MSSDKQKSLAKFNKKTKPEGLRDLTRIAITGFVIPYGPFCLDVDSYSGRIYVIDVKPASLKMIY